MVLSISNGEWARGLLILLLRRRLVLKTEEVEAIDSLTGSNTFEAKSLSQPGVFLILALCLGTLTEDEFIGGTLTEDEFTGGVLTEDEIGDEKFGISELETSELFVSRVRGMIASLYEQCSKEFQKLSPCLPFATAKAAAPSKDCCDMEASIRDSHPACLCYIIQRIHNGSNPEIKNLGVQEARLLQLPSACKLANSSISECPKLLGLPPNSPGAAIFTNSSNGTSSPATSDSSNGFTVVGF
ncbi:unnamed protein product [Fraxinus pennsylvanica]|uniref:Bifunctional inhibitor/plant lipid transfer protein/seed storage helical domain-containing protein n=1 Tax=Fraxinus pennsylvanica TaxID=56036 RepID=A0AAD1ZTJ0_9LAMI|nr:unnamed protein product [Fraxinus pennsylvanica]